jgi:hypothetical protein
VPVPNSTTGGFLTASTPGLEGQDLQRFIQQWIVGVSGLPANMVRPRWQIEPPNIPTEGNVWIAFGIGNTRTDAYPYVEHDPTLNDGSGGDRLQRHEDFDVLCSAYDLGSTGMADATLSLFRDGTAIPQNRELLRANDLMLVEVGDMISVPTLLMQRWNYRVDMSVRLRRQIIREYPVYSILSASGGVFFDQLPRGIVVRFEAVTIQLPQDITVTQTTLNLPAGVDVQIIPENLNRRYLGVFNIGTSRLNLAFGVVAVADQGVPLGGAVAQGDQGGSYVMSGDGVSTQAIHAISAVGTTVVVLEG